MAQPIAVGSIVDKSAEYACQLIGRRYAGQSSSDLVSPSQLHSAFRGPALPRILNHHHRHYHLRHAYRAIRALHQILLRVRPHPCAQADTYSLKSIPALILCRTRALSLSLTPEYVTIQDPDR